MARIHPNSICNAHKKLAYRGWMLFSFIGSLLFLSMVGAIQFENALAWSAGLLYVTYDTWLLSYVAWKTTKLNIKKIDESPGNSISTGSIQYKNQSMCVLVPAYNESNGIIKTINHLLEQSLKPEKIIIVNDGSTDDTLTKISAEFGFKSDEAHNIQSSNTCTTSRLIICESYSNLFLFDKNNSGKADSLNQVIQQIDCDIIVTVDADTLLENNAIHESHKAFTNNPNLVAACGVLKPVTNGGLIARLFGFFQYFEYLRAYLSRAAWAQSNALLLVSGAFSVYRKSALLAVEGYDDTSLVEDYELIHRMHKYACDNELNWHVDVIENARATTDAPTTISAFINQRKRWFTGFLRTQFKYRNMIGNTQYNHVGRFMLPIKTVDTLQPVFGLVALILLLQFIFSGAQVSTFVLTIIGIKLAIDYCFHIWSLYKYHSWLQLPISRHLWWQATICCLTDPFIFQPLRHLSALIGWLGILKNNVRWEPIRMKQNNLATNP